MKLPRKKWIVDYADSSPVTHPATFGILRCWTFRQASRVARRYSRQIGKPFEVYGPIGKGE